MNRTLEIDWVMPSEDLKSCKISYVWRYEPNAQDLIDDLEIIDLVSISPVNASNEAIGASELDR